MKFRYLLGMMLIISMVLSGCGQKECETAADCSTKTCFTVQCKDNKCTYSIVSDCCGNEKCEPGEDYEDCADDCPNCDDKNECTIDEYDYHKQECVNAPVLDRVCCGNAVCEVGEDYSSCARDCPNCDDENECTKDSYDYHKQECINEPVIPCCGNEICDEDAETYSSCSTDCPDCDDGDRLTTDSFNYITQKCENSLTHYFIEDFEEGDVSWKSGGEGDGWEVYNDDGNNVFRGIGYKWNNAGDEEWDDYNFEAKFKLINGGMHFIYRLTDVGRYFIGVHDDVLTLSRTIFPNDHTQFERAKVPMYSKWHTISIVGKGDNIKVYVDGKLRIDYTDTEPLLSGRIGLEVLHKSEVYVDDVEVKVIS